jgi:ribosomal-protein-serine acetyltransferase
MSGLGPARDTLADGLLRRWTQADLAVAHRVVVESLDHLAPWMPWARPDYCEQDALAFLRRCVEEWERGETFNYAIVTPDGEVAGSCGLMSTVGPGALEIGYWLRPGHTGRGLATMAAAALTDEAFRLGVRRVVIGHDALNTRSGAVPARLGFTEVERRPAEPGSGGTVESGIHVVWQKSASGR